LSIDLHDSTKQLCYQSNQICENHYFFTKSWIEDFSDSSQDLEIHFHALSGHDNTVVLSVHVQQLSKNFWCASWRLSY